MASTYPLRVRSPTFPPPTRAQRLASSASRLQAAVAEPRFASATGPSGIVEKLDIVCYVTHDLSVRYSEQFDTQWSRRFPVFESDLADAADYTAVLAAPGRPPISAPEIRRLEVLADQLLDTLGGVAGDLLVTDSHRTRPRILRQAPKLASVAAAYAQDARLERNASSVFFSAATVLLLSALGLVILGLVRSNSAIYDHEISHGLAVWPIFSTYLVASLISLVAAAFLILIGERHRRATQEATRLARQFDAVESYLEPMAPLTRDLVRASLTPRLFSRILWDDDPIREPIWPTAGDIASARSPRHRARTRKPTAPK
jgi:hypothetical protein